MTEAIEITEEIERCPGCGKTHFVLDHDRGERCCSSCGTVIECDIIDQGPEYRTFRDGADREHYGAPESESQHDKGLTTEISSKNRDSYGKSLSAENRAMTYRLRKLQKRMRVSNATERNQALAMGELGEMTASMSLPLDVRNKAANIYKKAVRMNLIRGRSIKGVVAASLYAACRAYDVPRTLDEIADGAQVGRKEIGRTFRFVKQKLKLKLDPTRPQDYVQRFCSELNLSGPVNTKTMEILNEADKLELTSGKGPTGIAAAAIYISGILHNERRTQKQIADVAGVTEVTIRNRYKELVEKLGIEIRL